MLPTACLFSLIRLPCRHFLLIEKRRLSDKFKATHSGRIKYLEKAVEVQETNVLITYKQMYETVSHNHCNSLPLLLKGAVFSEVQLGCGLILISHFAYLQEQTIHSIHLPSEKLAKVR